MGIPVGETSLFPPVQFDLPSFVVNKLQQLLHPLTTVTRSTRVVIWLSPLYSPFLASPICSLEPVVSYPSCFLVKTLRDLALWDTPAVLIQQNPRLLLLCGGAPEPGPWHTCSVPFLGLGYLPVLFPLHACPQDSSQAPYPSCS